MTKRIIKKVRPRSFSGKVVAKFPPTPLAIALLVLAISTGCQTRPPEKTLPDAKSVIMTVLPETTWPGVPLSDPNPPARIPSSDVSFSTEGFTHRTAGSDLIVDFELSDDATFPLSDGTGMLLPEETVYIISPSRKQTRLIWKSAPKEISQLLEAIQPNVSVSFDRTGRITSFLPGDDSGPTLIEIGDFRKVPAGQSNRWNFRITDYRIYLWPTGKRKRYLTPSVSFPPGIWCYGLYETGKASSPFELIRFYIRETSDGIRIREGTWERSDEVFSEQTQDYIAHQTVESYVQARFSEDPPWLSFRSPGRLIAVIDQVEKGPGSDNAEMVKWVSSLPASEDFTQAETGKSASRKTAPAPTVVTKPAPANGAKPAKHFPTQKRSKEDAK
jgi:hypothetical protein